MNFTGMCDNCSKSQKDRKKKIQTNFIGLNWCPSWFRTASKNQSGENHLNLPSPLVSGELHRTLPKPYKARKNVLSTECAKNKVVLGWIRLL